MTTDFGFKKLTTGNVLEPDPINSIFGFPSPTTHAERLEDIFTPVLKETVPVDVRAMFAVAQGIMAYGHFFYPLYTVGHDELLRVAEAAITHKCGALCAPPSGRNLKDKIDWLEGQGVLTSQQAERWHHTREFRNEVSHPQHRRLVPPGVAIGDLQRMAAEINALYS